MAALDDGAQPGGPQQRLADGVSRSFCWCCWYTAELRIEFCVWRIEMLLLLLLLLRMRMPRSAEPYMPNMPSLLVAADECVCRPHETR